MARVEDLIAEVPDSKLRAALAEEVRKLKKGKKFGLVFEEHSPETTQIPGYPIRPGTRVAKRDGTTDEHYLVRAVRNGSKAVIVPERGGSEETVPLRQVVAVKKFGEPIYPALVPVDKVVRAPGKPFHTIINADNYHALQLLLYCYEGQVDVIYIDPPYNTGARDWKYNNRYVDSSDQWRHSKWLSMMSRRLELARRLLRRDGVLIVTIDENEVHHLGMLLEAVMPDYSKHMVSIVINPAGAGKTNFARVDEYAIYCVPPSDDSLVSSNWIPAPSVLDDGGDEDDAVDDPTLESAQPLPATPVREGDVPFPPEEANKWELRHARRRGNESSYRHQRPNQFYPIYVDPVARQVVEVGDSLPPDMGPSFSKRHGLVPIWPIDSENNHRCWRFVPETMRRLVAAKRVVLGRYNKKRATWTLNIWERKSAYRKLRTVWAGSRYDAGTHGTSLLHRILGRRFAFPFPKSLYAVRDALASVCVHRPQALIVDFFAGSGTTLHGTALLNAEDGGTRRCILVSNNEVDVKQARLLEGEGLQPGDPEYERYGICDSVTWPRCRSAVRGRRDDDGELSGSYIGGRALGIGFEENVEYVRLGFLDPNEVARGDEFEAILPILWLMAGAKGERETVRGFGKWFMPRKSPFAVLLQEQHFRAFRAELRKRPDITHVFIVTDSPEAFREMVGELSGRQKCFQLYKSYLENFRINMERTA